MKHPSIIGTTGYSPSSRKSSVESRKRKGYLKQHQKETKLLPRRAKAFTPYHSYHRHSLDDDSSVMRPHLSSSSTTPQRRHRPVSADNIAPASRCHDYHGNDAASAYPNKTASRDGDLTLAAEAPTQSSSPSPHPSVVASPAVSPQTTRAAENMLSVTEMGENVSVASEGVPVVVETLPPQPTSPLIVEGDEFQIGRLKKDVQRLEAAIRNIESRKTELSDWFLDQMLVARCAGDDCALSGNSFPPEMEIKRSYKRRNAELKQRLTELESRLSDTRRIISQLEEGVKLAANERKTKQAPSSSPLRSKSTSTIDENRLSTGQIMAANEDTDASVSLTNATLSAKAGGEPQSVTNNPPQKFSRLHRDDVDDENAGNHVKKDRIPDCLSQLPPIKSSKPSATKVDDVPSNFLETQVLPALQPSPYLGPVKPHSEPSSHLRPSGSSGDSGRPVSGSSEASRLLMEANSSTSPRPQPASAKKPRISARKAFKHGFEIFTKPFGRRSDVMNPTLPVNLKKSASDDQISTPAYGNRADAARLQKAPSATNTWANSIPVSSKRKKSTKHGNGGFSEYLEVNTKKSHADSISSRPSHQLLNQQQQRRDSGAVSGAGSEAPPSSSSPHAPPQISSVTAPLNAATAGGVYAVSFKNILDALYGVNNMSATGLLSLSHSNTAAGNNLANYSGGGSTHSGGGGGVATGGGLAGSGIAPLSANLGTGGQTGALSSTPPLGNVALALALMCQQTQVLMDAQAEAQQKMISEIKEELSSLRMDLTEMRDIANAITVEVEALRRDMQTKEEVYTQKLVNAVARLEQLDASAEKLRQHVQQDFITIRNEQKHALEPLKYQLATETRDLRDMFTTLSNKVTILEKCERLSNLDRDQPRMLRSIANALTDLLISFVAFITTLIQMLIRFLNAGATITNNRVSAIILNVCLLIFLLVLFLPDSLARWWDWAYASFQKQSHHQQPSSSLSP